MYRARALAVRPFAKRDGDPGPRAAAAAGDRGIQTPVRHRTKATEPKEYLDYTGYYDAENVRGLIVGTKRQHDSTLDPGVPEGPTIRAYRKEPK